jgi:hypothetical protein
LAEPIIVAPTLGLLCAESVQKLQGNFKQKSSDLDFEEMMCVNWLGLCAAGAGEARRSRDQEVVFGNLLEI